MVSGFGLGGFAKGFESGFGAVDTAIYDQGLLKLAQQRLQQEQQNKQRAEFMQLRSDGISHLQETMQQLRVAHPDWTDQQLASNPAVVSLKNMLGGFDKNLGLPDTIDSIVANFAARPSEAETARTMAAAKEPPGAAEERRARAGYYERGGLPKTDNPDLDVSTQLGSGRVAQAFGALNDAGPAAPTSSATTTDQGKSVLNNLAKQSGLLPEALDAAGRAWAGGNTSILSNFGRGKQGPAQLSAIKQWGLYSLAHDHKLTPQQAADQLNFNVTMFGGQKAEQTTIGRRAGSFALAENEFEQISGLVLDASKNVPRTEYKSINDVMNAWREQTGDPYIVQLGAAINSAINVYARAISPTGTPTVSDKDHARDILQKGWSDGQVGAAIAQLRKEIAAAKKSIPAARNESRGKPQYKFNPDTGELE